MNLERTAGSAALLGLALLLGGCVEPSTEPDHDGLADPADAIVTPTPASPGDGVESWLGDGSVDSDALKRWLDARAWRRWTASPSVKPSPQGGSRVFVNGAMQDALVEGVDAFPLGAIGVRELYEDDLFTPRAINLTVKLTEDDGDGVGWLWVEVTGLARGGLVSVEEPAAPRCVGCHAVAVDHVQSTWPLR